MVWFVVKISCGEEKFCSDCHMENDMKWLPDKCIAQKKVSSLSSWLRHVLVFLTASSICTYSHLPRSRKKQRRREGEIKVRRKKVIFGCSCAVWVMPLSSKAHFRGHPGLFHSAPLAFMFTENVSMMCAAYRVQKKPNVVLQKQIVFSDYVSLSFVSYIYNFGLTDYG